MCVGVFMNFEQTCLISFFYNSFSMSVLKGCVCFFTSELFIYELDFSVTHSSVNKPIEVEW